MLRLFSFAVTTSFFGMSSLAIAQQQQPQPTTIGQLLMDFIQDSWNPVFLLIVVTMGVVGIFFIARGLTSIVAAAQQNGRTTYTSGISMLLAGAMLVALPDVAGIGMTSLLGEARGDAELGSGALDYNDRGMEGDFRETIAGPFGAVGNVENCLKHDAPATCIASNIARNVIPMAVMALFAIVFIVGLISFAMAIIDIARSSERGDNKLGKLTRLVTSILLMNSPLFYTILTTTLLGDIDSPLGVHGLRASSPLLSYPIASNLEVVQRFAELLGHAFTILTFFGAWAFVRGIFMIKGVAEGRGQGSYGMAITYMVAGVLMANSKFSACAILGTFGGADMAQGFC